MQFEALAKLAHIQRVHAVVFNARCDQPGDHAEAAAARQRHAEASTGVTSWGDVTAGS